VERPLAVFITAENNPTGSDAMKRCKFVVALAASLLAAAPAARAADARAILIDTFDSPVYVTGAPGESTLLFVVEQTGKIRVLDNEVKQAAPFLDLTSLISCCDERGVLSMAFPPDYATSRLFYVAFTNTNGDVEVDEFHRAANHKRALPASRRKLLAVNHRGAGNHNGGQLQFGPDGYLYISVGDGGELTPRGWPAPDLTQLLGKILRIDPKPSANRPYTIPPDNPYVKTHNRHQIYAYGFRNPWRFSFEGKNIVIADVGQSAEEEINYLNYRKAKGANFGWPQYEGNEVFDSSQPGADPPTFPMLTYNHNNGRCAVIGGYVSHDPDVPALSGRYLYGDLCAGKIRSMVPHPGTQKATDVRFSGITAVNLSSFGRGPNNRLYITQTSGELSRIAPPAP
jgi:glucose/arabinose dehydrogenase